MITGFQFRAAKAITKLSAKEIANIIGLHQVTLLRFGRTNNMEYLRGHSENIFLLQNLFFKHGISFVANHSIKLNILVKKPIGLTRFQLVSARIATRLNQRELSQHIKISAGSLSLLERKENFELIKNRKVDIFILRTFFEHLGITFKDDLTVTLKKDPSIFFTKNLKC